MIHKFQMNIKQLLHKFDRDPNSVELLAATKKKGLIEIENLIAQGQQLFGENKVQEALTKWPQLKKQYPEVKLHLIGHLQSNKVKEAVALFDTIESLDSIELARKLYAEENRQNKKLIYLIQINIGREPQKSGVYPEKFLEVFKKIRQDYPLAIAGIMCIPPQHINPEAYFKEMHEIAIANKLSAISMGMSDDYPLAIKHFATIVRIGRGLFCTP